MLLRYLSARLRHRRAGDGRWLRLGFGLDRRERELREFWEPHYEHSRAAQRRWLERAHGMDLAVLGAGKLRDFEPAAAAKFRRLLMIDADPASADAWRSLPVEVEPRIGDLTGCVDRWLTIVAAQKGDWRETLAQVRAAGESGGEALPFAADAAISLNVLSQLPIGWQDAVEALLERRFGKRIVKEREEVWLAAVEPGARYIVERHLAALSASGARSILLLADLEYAEYRGGPAPHWENGAWTAEPGVSVEVFPSLYGVEMAIAGCALQWTGTWLWHISPLGRESGEYGAVHRVGAFAFERE